MSMVKDLVIVHPMGGRNRKVKLSTRGTGGRGTHLPSHDPPPTTAKIVRFKIPMPVGSCVLESITRRHPDLILELNGMLRTGKEEVTVDFSALGSAVTTKLTHEIQAEKDVKKAEVLSLRQGFGGYRVTKSLCPVVIAYIENKLVPRYPITLKGGIVYPSFSSRESGLKRIYARLEGSLPGTTLISVLPDTKSKAGILTSHQRRILHQAVLSGYYDVPRRITLTELAQSLGISKSSLWETMASIERKIMTAVSEEEGT